MRHAIQAHTPIQSLARAGRNSGSFCFVARLMTQVWNLPTTYQLIRCRRLAAKEGLQVFKWFRRREEAAQLARADADELVRSYGNSASNVARMFECDVVALPDGTTHKGRTSEQWRRVALLIENSVPAGSDLTPAANFRRG
jgi:hypothetical protein